MGHVADVRCAGGRFVSNFSLAWHSGRMLERFSGGCRAVQSQEDDADRLVGRLASDVGQDLVRFISKRIRTSAEARDLAQEAYVRLLRFDREDLIRDPRLRLYRIAANIMYEYELKRRAEAVGLPRWSDERRSDADSDQADVGMETLILGRRAVQCLLYAALLLQPLSGRIARAAHFVLKDGVVQQMLTARS